MLYVELILMKLKPSKEACKHTLSVNKLIIEEFYVLLTLQPGMIPVNNQLDAQFFMGVYFYSLHISGSHVPIIRRIIVSMRQLVYVILCR